jgi:AcrR family transcriptional regulator
MTTPRTQEERRAASRAALVRGAMHAFRAKGYAATTVADIVADTGYTAGAFYHQFTNKAECLWDVVAYRKEIRASWTDVAAELEPSDAALEDLVREAFARLSSTMEGIHAWTMVMVEFARANQGDVETEARLAQLYVEWVEEVAEFVRLLQAHGHVDAHRDATQVAMQLVAFSEGLATHAHVHSIEPTLFAQTLFDGFLRLLRP